MGAKLVWETFGPKNDSSHAYRPFGNATVNGFDLAFDTHVANMVPFANELRRLMASTSSIFYLTAAPECPYPDIYDGQMLNGTVDFDIIWVQFFNNPGCELTTFINNLEVQTHFNFDIWDNWAKNISQNKKVKVLLGAGASIDAVHSGYASPAQLIPIIQWSQNFTSFGGVMIWDAAYADSNPDLILSIRRALTTPLVLPSSTPATKIPGESSTVSTTPFLVSSSTSLISDTITGTGIASATSPVSPQVTCEIEGHFADETVAIWTNYITDGGTVLKGAVTKACTAFLLTVSDWTASDSTKTFTGSDNQEWSATQQFSFDLGGVTHPALLACVQRGIGNAGGISYTPVCSFQPVLDIKL